MIPARFAPIVFGRRRAGLMSSIVSGIATFRALDAADAFLPAWTSAWLVSWGVAFPVVLVIAPVTRRLVALLVRPA